MLIKINKRYINKINYPYQKKFLKLRTFLYF